MKIFPTAALLWATVLAAPAYAEECPPLLNHAMKPLRGEQPVNFCAAYRGKTILAVNTASQCGFTPQFKGLEAIYQKYKDRGLVVLGFPSNDFWQEHADPEKTAKVCYLNYGVTFSMFAKSPVRGDDANPFFRQLAEQSGTAPLWNFYKYLIDPQGKVLKVYPSRTKPDDPGLLRDVEQALAAAAARRE
jgi:glutathione peroxidase